MSPTDEPDANATHPTPSDPSGGADGHDRRQGSFVAGDQYNLDGTFYGGVLIGSTVVEAEAAYDVRGVPNPYLGLRAYTYAERDRYAGRERTVTETLERLTAPGAQITLLFVTGSSGSGKSSFAQAGLLPALEEFYTQRHMSVYHAVMRPGARPIAALADALTRLGLPPEGAFAAAKPFMTGVASPAPPERTVGLLVIDQFEELFTQAESGERATLIGVLSALPPFADLRTHIIATLRADYLPELFQRKSLYDIAKQGVDLRAMDEQQLIEAIQRPLRAYPGKRIQAELLERLARDAAGEAAYLPLLQVTLAERWRRGSLTLGDYDSLTDAIRRRADAVVAFHDYDGDCRDPRPAGEQAAILEIFLALVDVALDDDPRRDVRRRLPLETLARGDAGRRQLIADLCAARLLSASAEIGAGGEVLPSPVEIDIIHERLIVNWDRLREAIRARRSELRQGARFRQALREWLASGRSDDYLLEGVRLAEAEALDGRGDIDIQSDDARDLLRRSVAARELERQRELEQARALAEERERARREADLRADEQRLANQRIRRRSQLIALVAILAVMAAIAAVLLRQQAQHNAETARENARQAQANAQQAKDNAAQADAQRQLAVARELAAVSLSKFDTDSELSLLLANESMRRVPTSQGEAALQRALLAPPVLLTLHGHTDEVSSAVFSPDGAWIASASRDKTARIWDAATGKELHLLAHPVQVLCAAFSPSGKLLVTCGDDGIARIWSTSSWTKVRELRAHTGAINAAAFSPDGARLVTGGDDHAARVWRMADGQRLLGDLPHGERVRGVVFSPDGSSIATASADANAFVWDAASGTRITTVEGVSAAYSPDGVDLLTGGYYAYRAIRWNATTGEHLADYASHSWYLSSVAFSPDQSGRYVASASLDHTVKLMDAHGLVLDQSYRSVELATLRGHQGAVNSVAFSPDTRRLVTASSDRTIRVWDIAAWEQRTYLGYRAAYSADGNLLAVVKLDATETTVHIWDVRARREISVLKGHAAPFIGVPSFRRDGKQIATASDDGTARVWDVITGQEKVRFESSRSVQSAVFSPDGSKLLTCGFDGLAHIWDLATRKELVILKGHTGWLSTAIFNRDGTRVLTASSDGTAKLWDIKTRSALQTYKGHADVVLSAFFSPNERQLVTASVDGTARLWDVASGKQLLVLQGHANQLTRATFSPDGRSIATSSIDGTVRIWDASSGAEIARLSGFDSSVPSLDYSPDGQSLVTSTADGLVRIHALNRDTLLRLAGESLHRALTCAERRQYLQEQECSAPAGT